MLPLAAAGPAHAVPDASSQGGADGVLFMTEKTDGAIYVGDFKATPTAKSTYWQSDGSLVDEVAVTQTRVAWASSAEANPNATPPRLASNIQSKVLISNVGTKAGTVTTVDIPNSAVISGLAADYFNERFYLTTKAGDIYSVKSDGTDLVKLINADASVQAVSWGFWFDSYNAKAYWCNGSSQASTGTLTSATLNGSTLSTPTTLDSSFLAKCDGLGIDPSTQTIFAAAYQPVTAGGDDYWMSYTQPAGAKTTLTITGTSKLAPSSMFVSHATSKIYFTTEDYVYEVGYDGTGLRTLYTGTHTSSGFENLAVYYGKTLDTINSVSSSSSIKKKVYFAPGSAKLTKAAKKTLNKIAKDYKSGVSIDINGYVQKAGTSSNNKALSKARAKAVAKYLKSKGITATITYSGNGLPSSKKTATKARRATVIITPTS